MAMVLEAPSRVPPTVAQQVFVIGSGIAGGLAGLHLAREFAGVRDVPTGPVVVATVVSFFFTLGASYYLARNIKETY